MLALLEKVKAHIWMGLAILVSGVLIVQSVRLHNAQQEVAAVHSYMASEQAKAAVVMAELEAKARATEQSLQTAAAEIREQTNATIRTLSFQRNDLAKRVRLAEARAHHISPLPGSDSATSPGAAPLGDYGSELLGSFGEEDVDEAYRADTIRLHLAACYRSYSEAREALKGQP